MTVYTKSDLMFENQPTTETPHAWTWPFSHYVSYTHIYTEHQTQNIVSKRWILN